MTVRIVGFNDSDRLLERQRLINQGKYPHPAALKGMEEQAGLLRHFLLS